MPMKGKIISIMTMMSVLSSMVYAAEPSNPMTKDDKFSGDTKLGFIYSKTDNTSVSINTDVTLKYAKDQQTQELSLSTYYSNKSNDDGTNKYRIKYENKHIVTDNTFWFGNAKYEHDQFATYRHQALITTGIGQKIIDESSSKLEIGLGPGFRYSQRQSFDKTRPSEKQDDVIANAFINGSQEVSTTMKVGSSVRVDYGESNTTTTADIYFNNKLSEKLALVLDTEYIYNSQVAIGKNHDEIYSTVSLNYAF
ncbi:DUF481 domain-containing protein [Vibrio cholerae]|uniref:DUF481 domain-containing protein n=1 Tax=Vibrio cholerae TaxID=666 RepID=UPI002A02906D|nr:DUF481 domain-containing protein [Vibrio cholerae]EKF9299311.1 DUF481 domain-containing protein [Vibrio cholerae]EKF9934411.1 DUF481 domain-containing protein [Vibrio cholerae]EKF9937432.1 DUF481 domain-containing protein [Vibrio cholerae]